MIFDYSKSRPEIESQEELIGKVNQENFSQPDLTELLAQDLHNLPKKNVKEQKPPVDEGTIFLMRRRIMIVVR